MLDVNRNNYPAGVTHL